MTFVQYIVSILAQLYREKSVNLRELFLVKHSSKGGSTEYRTRQQKLFIPAPFIFAFTLL